MAQTENPFFDKFGIRSIYDNLRKASQLLRELVFRCLSILAATLVREMILAMDS